MVEWAQAGQAGVVYKSHRTYTGRVAVEAKEGEGVYSRQAKMQKCCGGNGKAWGQATKMEWKKEKWCMWWQVGEKHEPGRECGVQ